MAKRAYIAAFLVDDADLESAEDVVCFLSAALYEDGCSHFVVWSTAEDFVADHAEHGPIDAAYLKATEG